MLDRISKWLLLLLVAMMPFELRSTILGLSNLQWAFIATTIVSAPLLIKDWRRLARERIVIAAALLVIFQWLSALLAEEFLWNAVKGAIRFTAGFVLLCLALRLSDKRPVLVVWCVAAILAAIYAIADPAGFEASRLFRDAEFYLGDVRRMSGSFEYPNTAAAFFAISLPMAGLIPAGTAARVLGGIVLWVALILTYSRGAAVAVLIVLTTVCVGAALRGRPYKDLRPVAAVAMAGIILYVSVSFFEPLLIQRRRAASSENPISARYQLEFNMLRQRPGVSDDVAATLQNTGMSEWAAAGDRKVALSYHWYDTSRKRLVEVEPVETPITTNVPPNESVTVRARFRTPSEEGSYLLIWDLAQQNFGWFSKAGVIPGVIETEIKADVAPSRWQGDVSRWLRPEEGTPRKIDATVSRSVLWNAALKIMLDNPLLGVGPDNYRLLYGRYLGYSKWDSNVRSNSLYLELVATSGLLGLMAFLAVAGLIPWSWGPVSLAIAIFLVHGMVDVFLMTTPIYFGFWILVGLAHESRI